MAALNKSVRRLASELDSQLERVAAEIVSGADAEIESAVTLALKNMQVRGSNEIEALLNQTCGHLKTIQNRIEESFSASVTTQGEEAMQSIAQQFEELAQRTTEKWR